MVYRADRYDMRIDEVNMLETTQIRMLQLMCKKPLNFKIRNKCIREVTRVEKNHRSYKELTAKMVWACGKNQ